MEQLTEKLFIEKSIDVDAAAEDIWQVITGNEVGVSCWRVWWPGVRLESDWQLGSPVIWRLNDGKIKATGKVLFIDPSKVLRFSFRTNGESVTEEVTFVLHQKMPHTHLTVSIGNFADDPKHRQRYPASNEIWSHFLPLIKFSAETLKY